MYISANNLIVFPSNCRGRWPRRSGWGWLLFTNPVSVIMQVEAGANLVGANSVIGEEEVFRHHVAATYDRNENGLMRIL